MEIISIVLIVAALLVIVLQALLIYNYIKKSNKTRKIAGFATVITCLISILFIVIIYIVNSTIAEETYSTVNTSIGPTAMPYLAILFSVIGGIGSFSIQSTTNKDVAETTSPVLGDNSEEDNEIEHQLNK